MISIFNVMYQNGALIVGAYPNTKAQFNPREVYIILLPMHLFDFSFLYQGYGRYTKKTLTLNRVIQMMTTRRLVMFF